MSKHEKHDGSRYRDLAVLSIVPIAVVVLTLASWILAHWDIGPHFVNAVFAIVAVAFGGYQRFISGFKDIFKRKITVNVFVVVALLATMAIGEFKPAAIIVFIMAAAGALESYTLDKTRKSIRDLLDFAPSMATVRRQGEEVVVPVAELRVGDVVVVKPGARIPVDGVVTAGVSNMARRAVLIKGGIFLELGHKINRLLVDKTGTFTFGRPRVEGIVAFNGKGPEDILRMACIAEKYSEHPLGRSILAAGRKRNLDIPDPDHFESATGMGVRARWNTANILVGKQAFLQEAGVPIVSRVDREVVTQSEHGRTAVLVAHNDEVMGLLAIADEIRPEIPQIVRLLKTMGVERITMLTGDHPHVAEAVADAIGVDDFQAELLPEQKQEYVRRLRAEGHIVGMIGDGVNDAPALALADVGIAMGAAGTDVAIETADVTLMNDHMSGVADFIWMSAKVLRRIKLNIFFSMIYNVIGLALGVMGMLTPIIAVIFQEAGCVTVVLSSTLLLWARRGTAEP